MWNARFLSRLLPRLLVPLGWECEIRKMCLSCKDLGFKIKISRYQYDQNAQQSWLLFEDSWCHATRAERTSPSVKPALWGKRPASSASDVTFVTVVAMFVWILADVAGDALEARPTAAWAVAVDTVKALQVAGTSINMMPIKRWRLSVTYRSPVVAGVLESSDAGFTVWSEETFTALCNLRNTCTLTEALLHYVVVGQLLKLTGRLQFTISKDPVLSVEQHAIANAKRIKCFKSRCWYFTFNIL